MSSLSAAEPSVIQHIKLHPLGIYVSEPKKLIDKSDLLSIAEYSRSLHVSCLILSIKSTETTGVSPAILDGVRYLASALQHDGVRIIVCYALHSPPYDVSSYSSPKQFDKLAEHAKTELISVLRELGSACDAVMLDLRVCSKTLESYWMSSACKDQLQSVIYQVRHISSINSVGAFFSDVDELPGRINTEFNFAVNGLGRGHLSKGNVKDDLRDRLSLSLIDLGDMASVIQSQYNSNAEEYLCKYAVREIVKLHSENQIPIICYMPKSSGRNHWETTCWSALIDWVSKYKETYYDTIPGPFDDNQVDGQFVSLQRGGDIYFHIFFDCPEMKIAIPNSSKIKIKSACFMDNGQQLKYRNPFLWNNYLYLKIPKIGPYEYRVIHMEQK
jgi:hypothetical protein